MKSGTYIGEIVRLELVKSKGGLPMVVCVMDIRDTEEQLVISKTVTNGYQIHLVNNFLRSLSSGISVRFKTYTQYSGLICAVADAVADVPYVIYYSGDAVLEVEKWRDAA